MRNQKRLRDIFNMLKQAYKGVIPVPSSIRRQVVLKNNASNYEFFFDDNKGENTEVSLSKQDTFVITDLGFYLAKEPNNKKGSGIFQTYVNTTYFPPVAGFDPNDLQTIYNGVMSSKTDNTTLYEKFAMDNFMFVPQAQQSLAISKSQRNSSDGRVEIDPLIYFDGRRKNSITVSIPTYTGIAIESTVANTDHLLVCVPSGFLLSNINR